MRLAFRLPIFQGMAVFFMIPVVDVLNLPEWKCPDMEGRLMLYVQVTVSFCLL